MIPSACVRHILAAFDLAHCLGIILPPTPLNPSPSPLSKQRYPVSERPKWWAPYRPTTMEINIQEPDIKRFEGIVLLITLYARLSRQSYVCHPGIVDTVHRYDIRKYILAPSFDDFVNAHGQELQLTLHLNRCQMSQENFKLSSFNT